MSRTRAVRPTDLVALVSFDGKVYPNEARPWDRLGSEPATPNLLGSAVEQWFSFATGRQTWISIQGQTIRGLISARRRGARTAWEVDCLIAAAADGERVALSLFEQLSAGAVRAGAHKLFLRVEAGSDMLAPARRAGFVPYVTEHLLRTDAPPPADVTLPAGLTLRARERADEQALFLLYNRVAPADVRMIEAMTLAEWRAAAERRSGGRGTADLVAEREGRVVGWLRTARDGEVGRLDLVLDPAEWSAAAALAAWALRDLGKVRPVFVVVPAYARPVLERLQRLGFAPSGEYALLAKRLAQPVRAGQPVRATVKPAPTV
jgi:hypothetical protein